MKATITKIGFGAKAKEPEEAKQFDYKASLVEHTNYPHEGTHLEPEAKVYINDEFGWVNAQIFGREGQVMLSVCEYTAKGKLAAVFQADESPDEVVEFFAKEQEIKAKEKAQQDEYRRSQMYDY